MLDSWHLFFILWVNKELGRLFVCKSLVVIEIVVVWVSKLESVFFRGRTLNQSSGDFNLVFDVGVVSLLGQVGVLGTQVRCPHWASVRENLGCVAFGWSH